MDSADVKRKIISMLEDKNLGKKSVNYKLRDWLFSRQRYWGEPFPILWVSKEAYERASQSEVWQGKLPPQAVSYKNDSGETFYALPLPEKLLPLKLPEVENYKPSGTAKARWPTRPTGST